MVDEEGMTEANVELFAPIGKKMVTLITYWPLTGKDRFIQRVIIRVVPYGADAGASLQRGPSPGIVR